MTHRSTKHQLQQKLYLNGRKSRELKAVTKVLALFTKWKANEIETGEYQPFAAAVILNIFYPVYKFKKYFKTVCCNHLANTTD